MARPLKEIDWNMVEQYMESGCSGVEIAAKFHIQKNTFYERFRKEYNCGFQDYHSDASGAGIADLKRMLHAKTLNNKAPGNTHLLMFMAKCKLGMREPESIVKIAPEQVEIDKDHLLMQQQYEIDKLKKEIAIYAVQREADKELLRVDAPV